MSMETAFGVNKQEQRQKIFNMRWVQIKVKNTVISLVAPVSSTTAYSITRMTRPLHRREETYQKQNIQNMLPGPGPDPE